MAGLTLTVLGCSGTYAPPGGACSGYLVSDGTTNIWVDAGSGTLANLQRHVSLDAVDAVVLSHEHPDHWTDLEGFHNVLRFVLTKQDFPVYAPAGEAIVLEDPDAFYAQLGLAIRPWSAKHYLEGGERIELAGIDFETLLVPGHSPAHLAFHSGGLLLSGDVLFAGSVGRTDLPGCSWDALVESIRRLTDAYPPETVILPGHGPSTTLGTELARNPYLAELRAS